MNCHNKTILYFVHVAYDKYFIIKATEKIKVNFMRVAYIKYFVIRATRKIMVF